MLGAGVGPGWRGQGALVEVLGRGKDERRETAGLRVGSGVSGGVWGGPVARACWCRRGVGVGASGGRAGGLMGAGGGKKGWYGVEVGML